MGNGSKSNARRKQVIIVDVNNLLYIGNHRFANYSVTDIAGNKIKTGGMYMIMNLLRRVIYSPTEDLWFFCFDRQSFRKQLSYELGVNYKTGRDKMPAHLKVQSDELYKWLPQMGYNALAVDGLESDDLINSLYHHTKTMDTKFHILSTDRDLAVNVSEKCDLISSNSKVASVTMDNYEHTIDKRGRTVYYNSILFFKVICGDDSDSIPPITKESYSLYKRLCNKLIEIGFDLSTLSDPLVVEDLISRFEGDLRVRAESNWQLIKPFILPVEQLPVKNLQINREKIYEFCAIFGMKSIARKFGMELTEYPEHMMKYRLELYNKIVELDNNQSLNSLTESPEEEGQALTGKQQIEAIDENKKEVASFPTEGLVPVGSSEIEQSISTDPLKE